MLAIRKLMIGAVALATLALPTGLSASVSGTVSGFVRDKETGNVLPGATVVIENTAFGATADKHGFYIIYNVPVGNHSLRATMIGYVSTKVTDVEVKSDVNIPVNFSLTAQVLNVEQEIVITAPRIKIYKDVIASVHYIGEREFSILLPAQTFRDALPLIPGFVANHFRGGRSSNTLYLIDGLPASGPLTRDLAFMVQNSAIAEMVAQTGGFNAEYGNVSAGLVNIITQEGRNDFEGTVKLATDVVGQREDGFENSQRAEFMVAGPLILGLGGPVIEANYLISGGLNLSDTPHHEALRHSFKFPVLFNYDLNAKFSIHASRNLYLRLQTLISDYDWRKYDAHWDGRLSALPKRKNRDLRLSVSLTHTLNSSTFYKLDLVSMMLRRKVLGDLSTSSAPININLPTSSIASAWPGATEPWNEQSVEKQFTAHLSLVRQVNPAHQLKVGVETNSWDLSLQRVRYLLWPNGSKHSPGFVYSRYSDSFRQFPFTFAGYFQHKIEKSNFVVNLGLRYELFSPNAKQTSTDTLANIFKGGKSRIKQTVAPRLSLAIPVGNIEHLSVNYGWFYEMPPLYYLYLNRAGDQEACWPLLGNVDLKPLQSEAWEVTYRRVVSPQSVYSLTYFYRKYEDLLDTSPYVMPGEKPKIIVRFENRARASMSGIELALKRDFSKGWSGVFSYTYLQSLGTASWPESNLLRLARGENMNDEQRQLPLAWDQRHTITYNLGYLSREGWLMNIFGKINSPALATDWLSGNQIQLPVRHEVDLKVSVPIRWGGLQFYPYIEINNVLDEKQSTPGEGGLDFSNPITSFRHQSGRQIWLGITYR
ncbi:MAG: TonB-dependent receptor [candidate division KSB1 bacterium]|nr:TonB-dependent receptor [candidate division KSB1 bacterium]MDZ7302777.1 TonB-dependent receptor [candidate division KSB1 bacterium]MDZ7310058.1 TonB-dependent receptor [candidate division KSB1 bacterium]